MIGIVYELYSRGEFPRVYRYRRVSSTWEEHPRLEDQFLAQQYLKVNNYRRVLIPDQLDNIVGLWVSEDTAGDGDDGLAIADYLKNVTTTGKD
jgi:hypothetical protein